MNFPKITAPFATLAAIGLITSLFVACGDDGESTKAKDTPSLGEKEVETFDDLPNCTSKREGFSYKVIEDDADYICEDGRWVNVYKIGESSSSQIGEFTNSTNDVSSSGAEMGDQNSSTSSASVPRDTVLRSVSIMGSATKGPFKFGSPVVIYELNPDNLRERTGVSYKDEVSSNQGHYVIPKVTLVSPYAELTVEGPFLSEVTGKNTTKNFELRSIANLADSSESNINLLTHLEANRILALMEKGYTFAAAKKQAEQEVMTSFNLANTVAAEHSTIYNNATLMAISLLFLGDRTEAEIQKAIDNYIADLEKDGQWNDSITKAQMADWAYETNWLNIHKNVDAWNIVNIANFHDEVLKYRDNMWGLGGCTNNRNKELANVTNKESKYLHQCFSCGTRQASDQWISVPYTWHIEDQIKCDTQGWAKGKDGEVKKGDVVKSNYYVYEGDSWRKADGIEAVLNVGCTESILGLYNKSTFVCDADGWRDAKSTEIDLQKGCIAATEGQIAYSDVYGEMTCMGGEWTATCDGKTFDINELFCLNKEITDKCGGKIFGADEFCLNNVVTDKCGGEAYGESQFCLNDVVTDKCDGKTYSQDQFCLNKVVTDKCGGKTYTENQFCLNDVVTDKCNGKTYSQDQFCLNKVVTDKCNGKTYTHDKFCFNGVGGEKIYNKCDGKSYDPSKSYCKEGEVIISTMQSCNETYYSVSEQFCLNNEVYEKCNGETYNVNQFCLNKVVTDKCNGKIYTQDQFCYKDSFVVNRCSGNTYDFGEKICVDGVLTSVTKNVLNDSRDGHTYKTVTIGTQTWMAENLNYAYTGVKYREGTDYEDDSTSWCYEGLKNNCNTYGRLYTWSAVMDSAAQFVENAGIKCGYGVKCTPNTPHRGICPEGWHVPTHAEFTTLYTTIGGKDDAGIYLKSTDLWESGASTQGIDLFGFAVLPAGGRGYDGNFYNRDYVAYLWSASESYSYYAYYQSFFNDYARVDQDYYYKYYSYSLRCLKD